MSKKVKVLLADDELPSLTKMYIDLLLKNYEVEATHEAHEVIPRIRRFRPDVVIISASLLYLDAHDLCCAAKEQELSFILLVSGPGAAPCTIGNCTASDTLQRPVDLRQLERKIGGVLVQGT
jgi:DNA-binding response OmpR family regulator